MSEFLTLLEIAIPMILFRFFLLAFNVAIVGFLIYKMVQVFQEPVPRNQKVLFIVGGTMLLLAPLGIFFRFFGATPMYFIVYPVAIFMFLYLTKRLK
jgi:hypothetical protein